MHTNNLGIDINSFEEMKELFFKYLPEKGNGPHNFEYTLNFFLGYFFEFPVFFNAKNDISNINHFKSIINDPDYDEYQKQSLFSCLCYHNNFENILLFFNSLNQKDKEYCASSPLNRYLDFGIETRKKEFLSLINDQELINIFKEVLELDSINNFNYIRRYSKLLIPIIEEYPGSLLFQEVKNWNIDDFIKKTPLNETEKYQKTIGWHLISHYPVESSDKQKKDVFFQLLKHIEKNYNDYASHYPYSIFAYNLIIEIDPLLSNIIKEPLSKLNPLSPIENIEQTKDYTFKILKPDIHKTLNKEKLLSIIEKELIMNNFKPFKPENIINKKRI